MTKSDIFTSEMISYQFTSDTIYIFTVAKSKNSGHKYLLKGLKKHYTCQK